MPDACRSRDNEAPEAGEARTKVFVDWRDTLVAELLKEGPQKPADKLKTLQKLVQITFDEILKVNGQQEPQDPAQGNVIPS